MLVTRPEPDASETAARLRALGIETATAPLLVSTVLSTSLPPANGFAAMAVTSANTLRALSARGALEGYLHLPLYAVGTRTAAAARRAGFREVHSGSGDFGGLAELLAHSGIAGPVFYPTAREAAGDLAKSLAPYGVMVITTHVYAMEPARELPEPVLDELKGGALAAALFYSRRTAETLVRLAGDRLDRRSHRQLGVLCISETVAEPLVSAHFVRVGLADHPSEEAMMGLALSFARDQNAP